MIWMVPPYRIHVSVDLLLLYFISFYTQFQTQVPREHFNADPMMCPYGHSGCNLRKCEHIPSSAPTPRTEAWLDAPSSRAHLPQSQASAWTH